IGALHSPRRELRNELKYVQSGVKMNEISCLKVGYALTPTCARRGGAENGISGPKWVKASELIRARPTWGHEYSFESSPMRLSFCCWFVSKFQNILFRSNYKIEIKLFRMTNTQTPPPATTVVNTTGAPVTNTVANHAERPEKFNGQNFKRWQQKRFFYLTILGFARFLKETLPQVKPPAKGQSSNAQVVQAVEAWKYSDFLCHNYVLNGLIDPLYNVYCKTTTAKEL
ncbi:hypothetical protein Tco_1455466, partial [Tanacetum coccineum]